MDDQQLRNLVEEAVEKHLSGPLGEQLVEAISTSVSSRMTAELSQTLQRVQDGLQPALEPIVKEMMKSHAVALADVDSTLFQIKAWIVLFAMITTGESSELRRTYMIASFASLKASVISDLKKLINMAPDNSDYRNMLAVFEADRS